MEFDSQLHCPILIVDDQVANVSLLESLLEQMGYAHLHSTTDPRQVLALYGSVQPDLILLDLHMPEVDGFEVLAWLRAAIPAGSHLPILVLTADAAPEARHRALRAGATDFDMPPDLRCMCVRIIIKVFSP